MGEYVWTQIVIGGKATRAVADELDALLSDHFHETTEVVGSHMVASGERNYGNADETEEFCQAHGLPYVLTWAAAGGCFDSGSHAWRPGMEAAAEFTATESGDVSISLPELRRDYEAGVTLAEIIARLAIADSDTLPPFEVEPGDAPDVPGESTDAAPAAPQTPGADPLDVLRLIHHEATTDIAGLPRDEALELVAALGERARLAVAAAEARPAPQTPDASALMLAELLRNLRNITNLYVQLQGHETAYSREARAAIAAAEHGKA